MTNSIRVWDLPTRLFHWLIVALVAFSWWSAETRAMEWHFRSGMLVLGLVTFRIAWGFLGGSTARFASFVAAPGEVLAYWRAGKDAPAHAGHNPLGALSVLALLGLLALQVITGSLATDTDGLDSGPLSFLISFDQSRLAAELHEISFNLLLALVVIHIAAIAFYRLVRRRNLVGPMLTGRDSALGAEAGELVSAGPLAFIAAAVIAITVTTLVWKGFFL